MLLVWLPLNGNLNNQGLGNVASDDSSTPVYKDYGKLGSQSIDLATRVYFNCSKLANIQQWTVAFWGRVEPKEDSTTNWQDLFGFTDVRASDGVTGTFRFETGYASDAQGGVHFHDNATQATTNRAYTFNRVEVRNEWHHYAVTVSDTNIKSYYDGNLVDTSTVNGGHWNPEGRFYTGTTNALNGCIQDLRIWDEAISAAEVKNISQGLVIHLPLDKGGLGQPNFFKNSSGEYITAEVTTDTGNVATKYYYFDEAGTIAATDGEKLTISFNYETYGAEEGYVYAQFNGTTIKPVQGSSAALIADQTSGKYVRTFQATAAQAAYESDFRIRIRLYGNATEGYPGIGSYLRIWNVKLEIGDKATLWCPNETDPEYNVLYQADDTIYDTSGYCYPTIGTNITYDSDTPRYSVCSVLDGTSYIKIDTNEWMVQGAQALTWSIWAYSDDWLTETDGGRLISCTESGGFNLEGGASGYLRVPFYVFKDSEGSSKGYVYYNSSIQLASLTPGWHLFTTTYSTSEINTYVDGVLTHSYSYTSYGIGFNKNARLYLGCEANTANPGGSKFVGKLSDFRLYYTTLSAEDVYDLYAVGASLSDTGVLFSSEVSEV